MKKLIVTIALFCSFSTMTMASGSFECKSEDNNVIVIGGVSSAGTWVKKVILNEVELVKNIDFTADGLYQSERIFNFQIMDQHRNRTLLRAELIMGYPKAAGIVTGASIAGSEDSEGKVIICEFLY